MASRTSKLIICVDTYRDGGSPSPRSRENAILRGVRVLEPSTLKEVGEAPVGAYDGEKAAVLAAVEDFYRRGGFRSGLRGKGDFTD